jgi:hypothetical protein
MTFPQKIIHFLGLSIGFPLRVFKLLLRKPKLNLTSSEESSKMSPKTPSQDSNFEWDIEAQLDAYRKAAEYDDFLFGDFDYEKEWLGKTQDDVK